MRLFHHFFFSHNLTRCSFHVHAADDLLSFKFVSLKDFFLQHLPTSFMRQLISMTRTFYGCSAFALSSLIIQICFFESFFSTASSYSNHVATISMARTFYDCSVLALSLLSLSLTYININNDVIIIYKCPKL